MNTIFVFVIGIAALPGLPAVMICLLVVSREMELPGGGEVGEIDKISVMPGSFGIRRTDAACNSVTNSPKLIRL